MTAATTTRPPRQRVDEHDRGTVRELYAVDKCKATRCGGSAVRWVATVKFDRAGHRLLSGAPIPLDMGRDASGLIVLDNDPRDRSLWAGRPLVDGDDLKRPRYTVHWSTCSRPELYIPVKDAADPLGVLPAIAAQSVPSPRSGPCSKCGAPHDNHYGVPRSGEKPSSPLCDECAIAAVVLWSKAERLRYAELWPEPIRRVMRGG